MPITVVVRQRDAGLTETIHQLHDAREIMQFGHDLDAFFEIEPDLPQVEAEQRTPVGFTRSSEGSGSV
jgi:hypothetical protein